MYTQQLNTNTDVRRSQVITRLADARELRPEEKLSPLDQENLDFEEALDKILATDLQISRPTVSASSIGPIGMP